MLRLAAVSNAKFGLRHASVVFSSISSRPSSSSSSSLLFTSLRTQVWCADPPTPTWICPKPECFTPNVQNTRDCTKCGTNKPKLLQSSWQCEQCDHRNPPNVNFCRECAAQFVWPKTWQCPSCNKMNRVVPKGQGVTPPECSFCPYTVRPRNAAMPSRPLSAKQQRVAEELMMKKQQQHQTQQDEDAEENMGPSDAEFLQRAKEQAERNSSSATLSNINSNINSSNSGVSREEQMQRDFEEGKTLGAPGFPWMCRAKECGAENNGSNSHCTQCKLHVYPSDWMCGSCGVNNFKLRSACFNCNAAIQPYWFCSKCSKRTSVYEPFCRGCEAPRPEPDANKIASAMRKNAPGFAGGVGGASSAGGGQRAGDWVCAVCHKFNYGKRTSCFSCETPRGGTADGQPMLSEITPVGDSNWRCGVCPAMNFKTRTTCWQCQAPRPLSAASEMPQQEEDANVAPDIEREGFQKSTGNGGNNEAGGEEVAPGVKIDDEYHKNLVLERRRKAIEWSGAHTFAPSAAALADDGFDWVCVKCMRKNTAGTAECGRCMTPKSVAPGSRALAAMSRDRVKKIHKI